MKIKLRLRAEIQSFGKNQAGLVFKNPDYLHQQLSQIKDKKRVIVTVEEETSERSGAQNRYLWGVVYEVLAEVTGYTPEEVHEYCKAKFLPPKFVTIGGETKVTHPSTAILSVGEMADYITKLIALAHSLGSHVPTPEEAGYISNHRYPHPANK